MKKSVLALIFIFTLVSSVNQVFAQDLGASSLMHQVNSYQNAASRAAATQQRKLSDVISRSNTLITTRLTLLNATIIRIQNDTRLSSDEKTSLASDVLTVTTGLSTLKSKIDADTDVQTAITDEKQIISSYHVYAVLEPKVQILIIINNMQSVISRLQAIVPQLQNLVTTLQSQGKDISQLSPLLTDINAQMQTILTKLTADATTVENIAITTDPTQNAFTPIKQDLSTTIKADFTKIEQDMSQMRPIFRQLIIGGNKNYVTPSTISTIPTTGSSSTSATNQ